MAGRRQEAEKRRYLDAQVRRCLLLQLLTVPLQKLTKRLAAMAMFALLFQREFRKRLAKSRKVKQRIVTKTLSSPGFGKHLAWRFTGKCGDRLAIASQRDHGYIFARISISI